MAQNWNTKELEASVVAYLEMRQNDFDQNPYSKKAYYRLLSSRFGRTEKAYEYRMQNISFVFSVMGREWVKGLRPAKNVGANVAGEIEKIINRLENKSSSPRRSISYKCFQSSQKEETGGTEGKPKTTNCQDNHHRICA